MRFITEFEVPASFEGLYNYHVVSERFIYNNKERSKYKLGEMIDDSFGWQNPVNNNPLHHRLEIEAFPMDKWIEFKNRFMDALPDYDSVSRIRLTNALADLESFVIPQNKKPG